MPRSRRNRSAAAGFARIVAAGALLTFPGVARAEPTPEEKAAATVLFREARALMDRGDIAPACRRLEESHRLDPLAGTLLNMAVCHEKEGRTATAWVEFRDAGALARRDGRDDRIALAEEHMKGLEARLCTVRIVVGPRADVAMLEVRLDGSKLARPAWDTPLPVDPGDHLVTASAPSKVAIATHVTVSTDGETKTVAIDSLDDAVAPVVAAPATPAPEQVAAPPPRSGLSSRRVAALGLGGAAVAGIALGSYFGVDAISKHSASNRGCPSTQCTLQGVADNDASKTAADRSTVAFGVSLAALGVATYLWLSGSDAPGPARSALRVVPVLGRDGAGLWMGRAF